MSDFSSSPAEMAARLSDLRARVLAKEPIEPEEYRLVIDALRRSRLAAAAPAPRKKTASTPIDLISLEFPEI